MAKSRETLAELVGGCADGVQLDPCDPTEPDDWPDVVVMESKETGSQDHYHIRSYRPKVVKGKRVYYYDAEVLQCK